MTSLTRLPENLPRLTAAKLPLAYESAKEALATCERIDECKDWADKMAALASYAKQADDKSLEVAATRIRARAIRRCGELLAEAKEDEDRQRARLTTQNLKKPIAEHGVATDTVSPARPTATAAARDAGLSEAPTPRLLAGLG